MEPAAGEVADFPCSPDALALAKAAVENIVCPYVTFGPITLFITGFVAASDEKSTDVINAIASHRTVGEHELKIHAAPIPRAIIVKSNPRPGREKVVTHIVIENAFTLRDSTKRQGCAHRMLPGLNVPVSTVELQHQSISARLVREVDRDDAAYHLRHWRDSELGW